MMAKRSDYPKPPKMFAVITIYGPNIIAAEFDEYKRHRRIAGPSFSDFNNKVVHEETTKHTTELFNRWSGDGDEVVNIEHAVTISSKLAVMITTNAGESCLRHLFSSISNYALSQALAASMGGTTQMRYLQGTKW
jgi:hypothetical protein